MTVPGSAPGSVGAPVLASRGDFHCHSNRSDGVLTPTALVDLAASRGVRMLALTDHDTTEGVEEARRAASRHPGMRLVPGVELACDSPGTELHMLGLFVDPSHAGLQERMRQMREGRVERGRRIVSALDALGAPVDWGRVQEIAGEASIGRPHVARALIEAGHVETMEEAFDRYLARESPAYVPRERFSAEEGIALVREAGGLPVFAHPGFTDRFEAMAAEMARAGLFGLEVYYKHYGPDTVASLRALADRVGLFPTGGSDFHAFDRQDERAPGEIPLPDAVVEALLDAAAGAGCRIPEAAR
jgi:predicted metal-dependent phosphoesterase TrpH